jgi:hypothetical protein
MINHRAQLLTRATARDEAAADCEDLLRTLRLDLERAVYGSEEADYLAARIMVATADRNHARLMAAYYREQAEEMGRARG